MSPPSMVWNISELYDKTEAVSNKWDSDIPDKLGQCQTSKCQLAWPYTQALKDMLI